MKKIAFEAVRPPAGRPNMTILRRLVIVLAIIGALTAGSAITAPTSADASAVSCGGGRCTLYLSKSETRALANGAIPNPPAALPWQLRAADYALTYHHRWFAQQYANWGWCSGFRLSIYPWESQGYFGYACNWN